VQVNQPVSLHFSATHPIRTLHWLLSQCTTARRSKNTTLSVFSSSLFAMSCKAFLGNLDRNLLFLCPSFRSFARAFVVRSLVGLFVLSFFRLLVRSLVRSFVRSFACAFVVSLIARLFVRSFGWSVGRSLVRAHARSFIRSFVRSFSLLFVHLYLSLGHLMTCWSVRSFIS